MKEIHTSKILTISSGQERGELNTFLRITCITTKKTIEKSIKHPTIIPIFDKYFRSLKKQSGLSAKDKHPTPFFE